MRLIVVTKNKDKLREIKAILEGIKMPVVSLADLNKNFRLVENGKSFLENALKKALPVSKAYHSDYIAAEDSGLEVDCLQGAPGIYSKRYSGKNSTYSRNNRKLLEVLEPVSGQKRKAAFRCCLVLLRGGELIKTFEGKLTGLISRQPRGKSGFGYDPVVYLPAYRKTVAELPAGLKNKISHRAKAFMKLRKYFEKHLTSRAI